MIRNATFLICVLFLITSCMNEIKPDIEIVATESVSGYEYQVGLGYGFLDKAVRVTVDGRVVISVLGTDEIEQFAQLQGTNILASGVSSNKEVIVKVTIDGGQPVEQAIDLSTGPIIHIYNEATGLEIYNTLYLVLE